MQFFLGSTQTSAQTWNKNAMPEALGLAGVQPRITHVGTDIAEACSTKGVCESPKLHTRAVLHITGALFTLSAQPRESKLAHRARAQNTPFSSKMKGS